MLKSIVKRIVPPCAKNIYRLHGKFFYYCGRIRNLKGAKNYVLLLGTPVHENMGDHLITYAERMFLRNLTQKEIVEIPIEIFKLCKKSIINIVDNSIPIFIQGGGWMGSVWPDDERLIQDMIKSFPNNLIVIFPQSAYYEDVNTTLIKSGRMVYRGDNIHVFLRERRSYKTMRTLYPELKTYLEPDIAIYLKGRIYIDNTKNKDGIGICFRNDRENMHKALKQQILNHLRNSHISTTKIDTISANSVSEENRENVLQILVGEFAKYEMIITDRLHGMIISYIAGVPCIVIDNKTHKVSSVVDTWLKESGSIKIVESYDEFISILYDHHAFSKDESIYDFCTLCEVINNGQD